MQASSPVLREEVLAFALPAGPLSSFPVQEVASAMRGNGSSQSISCTKGAYDWHNAAFREVPEALGVGDNRYYHSNPAPPLTPPVAAFLTTVNQALKSSQEAMKPQDRWTHPPAKISLLLFGYISLMFLSVIPFASKREKSDTFGAFNATTNVTLLNDVDDGKDHVPSWVGVMLVFMMILTTPLIILLKRGVAEQAKRNIETQYDASRIVDKFAAASDLSNLHIGVYWRSYAFNPDARITPRDACTPRQQASALLIIARDEAAIAHALGSASSTILTRIIGKERVLDIVWRPLPMALLHDWVAWGSRWGAFRLFASHTYYVVPNSDASSSASQPRFSPFPWSSPPVLLFDMPNIRPLEGRCTDAAMQQIVSDANIVLDNARETALQNLPFFERKILFQAIGFALAGLFLLFLIIFCSVGIMASYNRSNAAFFPLVMMGGGITFAVSASLLAWRRKILHKYHNAIFLAAAPKVEALNTGFPANSEVHNLRVELFRAPLETEDVALRFIKLGEGNGAEEEGIHEGGRRVVV
jgi:hypothetical protein